MLLAQRMKCPDKERTHIGQIHTSAAGGAGPLPGGAASGAACPGRPPCGPPSLRLGFRSMLGGRLGMVGSRCAAQCLSARRAVLLLEQ